MSGLIWAERPARAIHADYSKYVWDSRMLSGSETFAGSKKQRGRGRPHLYLTVPPPVPPSTPASPSTAAPSGEQLTPTRTSVSTLCRSSTPADGLSFQRDNDVPFAQPRPSCRTVLFHAEHHDAHLLRQIVEPHHTAVHRHGLCRDANIAPSDAPIAQQPAGHKLRRIDPDSKTNPLRRKNGRRIHANHASRGIDQWPTRVPRIQRSIGLDNVVNQSPRIRTQRPTQRAHHARRHRRLKSIGRANRNHDLPHAEALRIAQRGRRQTQARPNAAGQAESPPDRSLDHPQSP